MKRSAFLFLITLMLLFTTLSGCLDNSDSDDDDEEDIEYYPPIISISSPRNRQKVDGVIDIEVNVIPERPGIVLEYYIDDDLLTSTIEHSVSWDTAKAENGEHFIDVLGIEPGVLLPNGTEPPKGSVKVNVYNYVEEPEENTPPTIEMFVPAGAIEGVYRGPMVVRGEVEDEETDLDDILMRLDEDEWFNVTVSSGSWHQTLDPGSFTGEVLVEVRAYDGELYSDIESMTLHYDNTPPDLTITRPDQGETISGDFRIRTSIDDEHDITYVSFSLDGYELQNDTEETCEFDTRDWDNGEYDLMVEAADLVGNWAMEEMRITIENNDAPVSDISRPIDGSEFDEGENIQFDGSDSYDPDGNDITFLWKSNIDGTLSSEDRFNMVLSTGQHTITLTVEDSYGEEDISQVVIRVIREEDQPPEVSITDPSDSTTHRGTIEVRGTATDPEDQLDSLDYRIDEGTWTGLEVKEDWSFSIDTTEYQDGMHDIEVRAVDGADNEDVDVISIKFQNEGLIVDIKDPANNSYVSGDIDIVAYVDDEAEAEYISFSIDDDEVQNGTMDEYRWDTTEMDDGTYTITVGAEDTESRYGSDEISLRVDNTPPEVTIPSPTENQWIRGIFMIVAEAEDASPTPDITIRVDGDIVSEGGSMSYDWDTTDESDGPHTIRVTVQDAAGNENFAERTVNVDNTPPEATITSPDDGTEVDDGSIFVEATGSDSGGLDRAEFFIDSDIKGTDNEMPYSQSLDFTGYENGDYIVMVRIYDRAGNGGMDSITVTVTMGEATIVKEPTIYELTSYATQGKERIVLREDNYEGVPISSPLLTINGITTSVEWSKSATEELMVSDEPSLFSSRLAISFWNHPEQAIVVDNYENSLLAAPLASFLGVPLLLYGDTTDEALWRLNTRYANQIIAVGDTPYNDYEGVTVLARDTILHHILGVAAAQSRTIDYLTVTFPGDDENMQLDHNDNRDNYVPHMSTFAAQFSAYRNGVTLTCQGDTVDARRTYLNATIKDWVQRIESAGHTIRYLLLNGDYYSLPMIKEEFTVSTVNGGDQTKMIPSDNWYLNKVGNPYQVEIAGGRVVAKGLYNMSYYIDRIVNYDSYLDGPTEPASPEWTIYEPIYPNYKPWANNALIYQGNAAEFAADSEQAVRNMLHDDGSFHTLDDTALAKECTNSGDARQVLMDDFANSNFIAIDADHGEPHACTMTFGSDDLKDMSPAVIFGVSCMLGQIDDTNQLPAGDDSESYNVHISTSMTYTLFDKGINVFLGSTRTALGSFGTTTLTGMVDYQPYQAPGLCYLYFQHTINDGLTSGIAFMEAKNDLYAISGDVGNRYSIWEYVHYGDPAFDPYVPSVDG